MSRQAFLAGLVFVLGFGLAGGAAAPSARGDPQPGPRTICAAGVVQVEVQNPRQELRPGMHVAVALRAPAVAAPAARRDLAQTKLATARKVFEATVRAFQTGQSDAEKVYLWSRRWLEAQRDLSDKKAAEVAALEAHRGRMKDLRKMAEQRYRAGKVPDAEALGAEFYVAEVELWLARAKAR
jgi:hypothetical protein